MREQIFFPVYAMFVWIAVMLFRLGYIRIKAIKGREVRFSQFRLQEGMPEKIQQTSNNVNNLFQLPVLFLIVCFFIYAMDMVSPFYLFFSWGFVILRVVHSWVHITDNNVNLRFFSYTLGLIFLCTIYTGLFLDIIK